MKRKPPATLTKNAREIWLNLEKEWTFTQSDYFLFTRALELCDRLVEAQVLIRRGGLLLKDLKTGKLYPNPAVQVEKDCMSGIIRAWRLLDLKVPPPVPRIGRPPNAKQYFDDDDDEGDI